MTLVCLDCGSERIEDLADDWRTGNVPCCPFCRSPLFDSAGKLLEQDATFGWCHNWHPHSTRKTVSYHRSHWDWRSRDLFDHTELLPVSEQAEMAAQAETQPDGDPTGYRGV